MRNFATILASTALIAGSAEAAKSLHMYDPMTLSQTYGPSNMQLAQTVTMAPPAAEAKPAAAEAKATPAPTPAAKNDPAQDAALKKKWCVENVESTFFNADGVPRTALEQFSTFVNQICPQLEAEVPMGVVVSQCFHTGYFLLRELRPLADNAKGPNGVQFKTDFSNYVDDFCENYADVLPRRTGFVRKINGVEDAGEFQDACFAELAENPKLNTWFDPIDPLSSITQKEICDLHYKLFKSLRDKQRTSLAEYVSFSYIASLDLFLNAHMQEDYENCVNQQVVKHPNMWVSSFVTDHPAFKNWESKQKTEVEGSVAVAVDASCADKQTCAATGSCESCDGCSIAISRIYFNYQTYLNNLFAATFKTYSETMFDRLHQANLVLEGATP